MTGTMEDSRPNSPPVRRAGPLISIVKRPVDGCPETGMPKSPSVVFQMKLRPKINQILRRQRKATPSNTPASMAIEKAPTIVAPGLPR